jgi:hypothetical protein
VILGMAVELTFTGANPNVLYDSSDNATRIGLSWQSVS